MWNDFITGLQFLSRIRIWPQTSWTEESFSKSVKWFALVGLCIGLGDGFVWWIAHSFFPSLAFAGILICSHFFWAGAICYDGLMDVADGVFSGRERSRMLEIMKDSHVGAFGVLAGVTAVLLRFAFFSEIRPEFLLGILIFLPVCSRWMMVVGITLFPYARREGLGKAFVEYSTKKSFLFATIVLAILLSGGFYFFGEVIGVLFLVVLIWGTGLAVWLTKTLGGLTGDCYGAIALTSEIAGLMCLTLWPF